MAKIDTGKCIKCGGKVEGKVSEPNHCFNCYKDLAGDPRLSISGEDFEESTY